MPRNKKVRTQSKDATSKDESKDAQFSRELSAKVDKEDANPAPVESKVWEVAGDAFQLSFEEEEIAVRGDSWTVKEDREIQGRVVTHSEGDGDEAKTTVFVGLHLERIGGVRKDPNAANGASTVQYHGELVQVSKPDNLFDFEASVASLVSYLAATMFASKDATSSDESQTAACTHIAQLINGKLAIDGRARVANSFKAAGTGHDERKAIMAGLKKARTTGALSNAKLLAILEMAAVDPSAIDDLLAK